MSPLVIASVVVLGWVNVAAELAALTQFKGSFLAYYRRGLRMFRRDDFATDWGYQAHRGSLLCSLMIGLILVAGFLEVRSRGS
jgi:hypothetical protein